MKQSSSWQVNSHSDSQEKPSFMEPECSLLCSHVPPLVPVLIQINPVHIFPPRFPKIFPIILIYTYVFWVVSFLKVFRSTFCMNLPLLYKGVT
jgi:hypothetical protein